MQQYIALVALTVKDYDEAIAFYTQKLNFILKEDTTMSPTKRWVVVAPPGDGSCSLLLAKASDDEQLASVGNQTGGRVGFFLYTDDCQRDYQQLQEKGVKIVREIQEHPYGTVAVFADLYGNKWDLIEPKKD